MPEKKIKFAVVGCGHIGGRHAAMIANNKEAELAALCDVRPKEILNIDQYNVPFFSSLEEMLSSDIEVDIVNICTPNGLHSEQSIKVLEAGKHVVCEKPMGITTKGCEKMIETADRNGLYVFVVMQNRYSPPAQWMKEIVESGHLGKIYMVHMNCFWNRDNNYYLRGGTKKVGSDITLWRGTLDMDGGTLFTQFSHFIDVMFWLFGDIENVSARFDDFNHKGITEFEDSGTVSFDFIRGGMGTMCYSTAVWSANLESSITVVAENGSFKIGGQYMNVVEYCNIKDYTMPELPEAQPPNDYGSYKGSAANHHYIIQNAIDTLKRKTSATTSAREGLKVVGIIEKIYAQKECEYV